MDLIVERAISKGHLPQTHRGRAASGPSSPLQTAPPAVLDSGPVTVANTRFNNVPDRYELFLLGEGEKKVTIEPETRVPNASVFKFKKEDHTLANLLRAKLFENEHVLFSAYKVPHPLFADFDLRVQTDGTISPKDALINTCKELVSDLEILSQRFTKEWELQRIRQMGDGMNGGY